MGKYFGREPRYSQEEAEAQAREAIDAATQKGRPPEEEWKVLGSRMGDINRELAARPPVDLPPPPPPRRADPGRGDAGRPRDVSQILRPRAAPAPEPAAPAPLASAPAPAPARRLTRPSVADPAPAPAKRVTRRAAQPPAPAKRATRASAAQPPAPAKRSVRATEPPPRTAAKRPAAKKRPE